MAAGRPLIRTQTRPRSTTLTALEAELKALGLDVEVPAWRRKGGLGPLKGPPP